MKKYKKYAVCDGYIGVFQYLDSCRFPIYRFPGGDRVGGEEYGERCFDTIEEAERYALENYGHVN